MLVLAQQSTFTANRNPHQPFPDLTERLERMEVGKRIIWENWQITRTHTNTFVLLNRWAMVKLSNAVHSDVTKWLSAASVRCRVEIIKRG